jgi:hypothetical protein
MQREHPNCTLFRICFLSVRRGWRSCDFVAPQAGSTALGTHGADSNALKMALPATARSVTDPIRCRSTASGSAVGRPTAVGQRHFPFGAHSGIARYSRYPRPKPHPRYPRLPSLPSRLVSPLHPATSLRLLGEGEGPGAPHSPVRLGARPRRKLCRSCPLLKVEFASHPAFYAIFSKYMSQQMRRLSA